MSDPIEGTYSDSSRFYVLMRMESQPLKPKSIICVKTQLIAFLMHKPTATISYEILTIYIV